MSASLSALAAAGALCGRIYARHPTGCCLHILLDDRNERDCDVAHCLERALEQELAEPGRGHRDCVALAGLLLAMTPEERAAVCVPSKVAAAAGVGHCATCKHWAPFERGHDTDRVVLDNGLGLCQRVQGLRRYDKDMDLWPEGAGSAPFDYCWPTPAAVEDLSDACHLRTAAGFGCLLHEAKP